LKIAQPIWRDPESPNLLRHEALPLEGLYLRIVPLGQFRNQGWSRANDLPQPPG
jgi:hypothetical protein